MSHSITRTPSKEIHIRTGSEGPRHDPYAYTEIEIRPRPGHVATSVLIHEGLGTFLRVGDVEIQEGDVERGTHVATILTNAELRHRFERATGYSPDAWRAFCDRVRARRQSRCPCGSRRLSWRNGYPGEELLLCDDCGNVLDRTFNEAAIR